MNWCQPFAYLMSLTLILPPQALAATVAGEVPDDAGKSIKSPESATRIPDTYDGYLENLELTSDFLRDLRKPIYRTAFDFGALLDSLNYDAEEIIAFSKGAIAYQQYSGVLRGPLGTLFSRAGNSIDQSLLLAKLLKDAGYEARIVGAKLNTQEAIAVLQSMKLPIQNAPPIGDASVFLEVLQQYGLIETPIDPSLWAPSVDYIKSPPTAQNSSSYGLVVETYEFITEQLKTRNVVLGANFGKEVLIREAQEYHWVQYKDGGSEQWRSLHPVFHEEPPFTPPDPTSYIAENVPESLLHRFRFQVFIERKVGDRLEVVPLTTPWERPVANMVGVPLTFSNVTDSMLRADDLGDKLESLLSTSKYFVPVFGNKAAAGAKFFDLRGTLIDPMVAGKSGSDLFATIGSAFGEVTSELGSEDILPTLTAQWLEFVLISPGGKEKVFRRMTFDRIGAAARRAQIVPSGMKLTEHDDVRSLLQQHTFMIAVGNMPRGFALDAVAENFERSRPLIDATLNLSFDKPVGSKSFSDVPAGWVNLPVLFSQLDRANSLGPTHRNYRSGPSLLVHSTGLARTAGRLESIDIISNPRRAVDIKHEIPSIDPRFALQAGIWETALEGTLLSGGERFNTWTAFETSQNSGLNPVVLLPADSLPTINAPANSTAAISADLASGYAVIAPNHKLAAERYGWWRIDIKTGETLGQFGDGRGQIAVEHLVAMMISSTFLAVALQGCEYAGAQPGASRFEFLCCVMSNVGLTGATAMMGVTIPALRALTGLAGIGSSHVIDVLATHAPVEGACRILYLLTRCTTCSDG